MPKKISSFNDKDWFTYSNDLPKFYDDLENDSFDYDALPKGITNVPLAGDTEYASPQAQLARSINDHLQKLEQNKRLEQFSQQNPEFLPKTPPPISSRVQPQEESQRDIASYLTRKYKPNNDLITKDSDLYDPNIFEEAIKTDPELFHSFHPTIENKKVNYVAQPGHQTPSVSPSKTNPSVPNKSGSQLPLSKVRIATESVTPKKGGAGDPDWDKLEQILLNELANGQYSSATSRLIGNLTMGVNGITAALANSKPDNTIPKSIIEGGNQRFEQAGKIGDKIRDYLKAKAEQGKLGMEKQKLDQTFQLQKERNDILRGAAKNQRTQYSPYDTQLQKKHAEEIIPFIKKGGPSEVLSFAAKSRELASRLRNIIQEMPGKVELMTKSALGRTGGEWFKSNNPELANIAKQMSDLFLPKLKEVMGSNQLSDADVETYLSTLYDWAVDPKASADSLDRRTNALLAGAKEARRMHDHWLKYHTFENYNPYASELGTYSERPSGE